MAKVASAMAKYGMEPTEWVDIIDSIYEALPKDRQDSEDDLVSRVQKVYFYAEELDWMEAGKNLLYNEIEDRIVGGVAKRIQDVGVGELGWEQYRRAISKTSLVKNVLEGVDVKWRQQSTSGDA